MKADVDDKRSGAPAGLTGTAGATPSGAAAAKVASILRSRLFVKYVALLVTLVVLALIANGAFEVWFSYQENKTSLIAAQHQEAQAAADKIEEFITQIQSQVGWTTQLPWSDATLDQRRFDALRLLRQVPAITELAQIDATGHEQLKVSRLTMDVVGSGIDYSDKPEFTQAVANKVYYGPVYFRRESEPYMTLSLAGARRDTGVSIAQVNLKLIWDVVSGIKVGERGHAYVVDADGRLIAHPDISLVLRNTDMTRLAQVKSARAGSASGEVQEADDVTGHRVLTAYAPVNPLGWFVFVETPIEEAYAPLYASIQRTGYVLLGALLLAFIAGTFLARRMVVPIQALRVGAARIGAGDLSQRISIKTGDEVEGLADQFNDMAARLQESYANLERKVEQRTHELSEALEQQTATSEVLSVISTSPGELEPVFNAMLANAVRICGAHFGNLALFDGKEMRMAAMHNAPVAFAELRQREPVIPLDRSMFGDLVRTKAVVQIADLSASSISSSALTRLAGAKTAIVVPMLREDKLVGAIAIYRQEVRPFTDKQIELVQNFAAQAVIAIENTRLLSELRESLDQQTATADVLGVISASPGHLEPVFQSMLENATRICEAKFGTLYRFDGEAFSLAAEVGAPPEYAEFQRQRGPFEPLPGSQLERVMLTKQVSHTADDTAEPFPGMAAKLASARAQVIVPMLKDKELIGAFSIYRREVRPFTDKQIALLTNFAAQAVIAIENTRLLSELRESLEQQTATADVLGVISSSPGELEPVFEAMLANAVRICGAKFGNLVLVHDNKMRIASMYGAPPAFAEFMQREPTLPAGSALARMLDTKSMISIADLTADGTYESTPIAKLAGARTFVGVPMFKEKELIGAIAIYRQEVQPFTDKQIELVQNFAAQAVIAIENTRLLSELRESLQQQTATADVLKVISRSTFDLQTVLDTLTASAARLCRAERSAIRLLRDGLYHNVASHGLPPEHKARMEREPIKAGQASIAGRAALAGKSVHVLDAVADSDPEVANRSRLGNVRTFLAVPLLREGAPIGVLLLQRTVVQSFSDKEIALAETFADQAVIAIENVRLFEAEQQRTAELSESLEQQTATSEVLGVISSSPGELQPVFQAMLANAVRICDARFGVLFRYSDNHFHPAAQIGAPPALAEFLRQQGPFQPPAETPLHTMWQTKTVGRVADLAAQPVSGPMAKFGEARSLICVPMLKEDLLIGAITIYRQEVRPFTDKQIELVQNFAAQAVIAIENTRLLSELRESLEQQTATSDVLSVISSSPGELEPVFQAMLANATRICEATIGILFRYEDGAYTAVSLLGVAPDYAEYLNRGPIRAGPATGLGRLAATHQTIQVEDTQAEQIYAEREPFRVATAELGGARSLLNVPMLKEGELIGAIGIYRQEVRPFSDKQVELVTNFANQAVIAIENTRLLNELRQRTDDLSESLEQQTAISEILRVISISPSDVQPVLDSVADHAARICEAQIVDVVLVENDAMHVAASFGDFAQTALMPLNRSTVIGRSICDLQPVRVDDLQNAGDEFALGREYALRFGHRSVFAVPLIRENRALGGILVRRTEVRPFEQKYIALLTTFADQAAIAIENVRLFNAEKERTRELAESLEQQTATSEVLKVISSSPGELQPVFHTMLENATRICGAAFGGMFRFENDALRIVARIGFTDQFSEFLQNNAHRPGPHHPFTRLINTRQTLHIPDYRLDVAYLEGEPMAKAGVEIGGIRTLLLVPMLKDAVLIGYIGIFHKEVQPFSDKQIELVTNFAAQAVIAIENTRLLSELRQSLEQQTATADVLRVISSSPGALEPVFNAMLENATRICEASFGTMLLGEGDAFRRVALHNAPVAYAEYVDKAPVLRRGRSLSFDRLLETKQVVHSTDMAVSEPETPITTFGGARTLLSVPMLKDDDVIGVIGIYRQEVRPFTDKQIDLVKNFAAQAVIAIENTRLLSELRQRTDDLSQSLEQQTATANVLEVISRSAFDLNAVFETVAESSVRLCAADRAFILRFDGELLRLAAAYNAPPQLKEFLEQNPIRPGRHSAAARAALERRTTHIPDILADPEYSYGAKDVETLRTTLAVPILKGGDLLGVLLIYHLEVRPFTDKQIAVVETFADQAAIAIENVRLFEDVQKRTEELSESLQQQTATSEVLKVISRSTFDLQTVLDTLVKSAHELCEADSAFLFHYDGKQFSWGADYGFSPEYKSFMQRELPRLKPGRGSLSGRVALERTTVHIPDFHADPEAKWHEAYQIGHTETLLGVPLLRSGALIGVLGLVRTVVRPFTDAQIELVNTFADQAVIAIENVRLFEDVQKRTEELGESLEQQTATSEVLKIISRSTFDLKSVLDTLVQSAARLCEADMAGIRRPKGSSFLHVASHGAPAEYVDYMQSHPIEAGRGTVAGRVLLEGKPIHIADVRTDPDYTMIEISQRTGFHTILGVPLLREGSPIGVMILGRATMRPFTDKQIELASTFADQAVIAIENVRLFEEIQDKSRQVEEASKHKSQFLANMSHELRTPLNAILGYTELILDAIYGEAPEKMRNVLQRIQTNGKHLLGLINDVLDLSKIEAGQLVLTLNDYSIKDMMQGVYVAIEPLAGNKKLGLKLEAPPDLPRAHGDERRLSQVLLNLVGNAIKFTDTGEVAMKASTANGSYTIAVTDTGPGIAEADQAKIFEEFKQSESAQTKAKGGTGLGLSIAKRIVEMHGGKLWVESSLGSGSTFFVELPVRAEQQAGKA